MQGNFLSAFDPFNADDGSQGLPGFNETIFGLNVFGIAIIILSSILLTVYLTKSDMVGKQLNNI